MTIVADLVTKIKADNSDFLKGMQHAANSAKNFSSKAITSITSVSGAMLKIASITTGVVTVAFGGLLNTVLDTSEAIDSMLDRAKKLSIDIGSLQKLQFSAKLEGVSEGSLDTGIKRLTKTVYEAQQGNKEAIESFKKLGISINELKGLDIGQQFELVSEKIKTIPNSTDQAGIALKIFGRSGIDLMSLLRSDIKATGDEFVSLGGVITDAQAEANASFDDSKDKISALWEAFKNQLTVAVVPALEKLNKWIIETIKSAGGLKPLAESFAYAMVGGISAVVQGFSGLLNLVKTIKIELLELTQAASNLGSLGGYGEALRGKLGFLDEAEVDKRFLARQMRATEIDNLKKELAGGNILDGLVEDLKSYQNTIGNPPSQAKQPQKLEITLNSDANGILQAVINTNGWSSAVSSAVRTVTSMEAMGVAR